MMRSLAMVISLMTSGAAWSQTPAFNEGLADRARIEAWLQTLSGPHREGAIFWSGPRSVQRPQPCDQSPPSPAWREGCVASRAQFAPTDVRRRTEPEFRLGWNSWVAPPAGVAESGPRQQVPPVQTQQSWWHVLTNYEACVSAPRNPEAEWTFRRTRDPGASIMRLRPLMALVCDSERPGFLLNCLSFFSELEGCEITAAQGRERMQRAAVAAASTAPGVSPEREAAATRHWFSEHRNRSRCVRSVSPGVALEAFLRDGYQASAQEIGPPGNPEVVIVRKWAYSRGDGVYFRDLNACESALARSMAVPDRLR